MCLFHFFSTKKLDPELSEKKQVLEPSQLLDHEVPTSRNEVLIL